MKPSVMTNLSALLICTMFFVFNPCRVFPQKADENLPMYGGKTKTAEEAQADKEFVKETADLYGSLEKAFHTFIDVGWKNLIEDKIEIAIQKFNKAWLLAPDEADSYFGFCMALTLQKKKDQAEKIFETGLNHDKMKKASLKFFLRASDIYERRGDTLMMIDYLKKASVTDFSNLQVYKKLAYYTSLKGLYDDAGFSFSSIIRLAPNDSTAYCGKAKALLKLKKTDEAIAVYSTVIEKCKKPFFDAYFGRAGAKYEKGDYQGSVNDYMQCIEISPKNGMLYRLMGVSKIMIWDQKGACDAWKKAAKLGDAQSEELYNSKCK